MTGVIHRGTKRELRGRRVALPFSVKAHALEFLPKLECQGAGLPALQKFITLEKGWKVSKDGPHRTAPATQAGRQPGQRRFPVVLVIGPCGDRTHDLRVKSPLLCQLS
jgi:hypothetical protein